MELLAAECIARRLLAPMRERLSHVHEVAQLASKLVNELGFGGPDVVTAAWLHDVGYASSLSVTGFHPLDGARWVRSLGFSDGVASLIAYHSTSYAEARARDLDEVLTREFLQPEPRMAAILTYCDMRTDHMGRRVTVDERLVGIRQRYGPTDPVVVALYEAEDQIRHTMEVVETWRRPAGSIPVRGLTA